MPAPVPARVGNQRMDGTFFAMQSTHNWHIQATRAIITPRQLAESLPLTQEVAETVIAGRHAVRNILDGKDQRLLVVVGPCSIHDPIAAVDYARHLMPLRQEFADRMEIVMRVYFEKPRTILGWKGLIMDPHLDGSHDIATGLRTARTFLREVLDLGLPTATELLDPITPQYVADLVCWGAIGARTTESQTHRQRASGLSMPLGFKNSTDGTFTAAINAIKAASQPQTFLGINLDGHASAIVTRGNPDCHVVLRGGSAGPNYSPAHIAQTEALLAKAGLPKSILVDCSHDNSAKKPELQPDVLRALLDQIGGGSASIMGAMIESNLGAGNQPFPQPRASLSYGVSITDGCIDWPTTEKLVRDLHAALAPRFA